MEIDSREVEMEIPSEAPALNVPPKASKMKKRNELCNVDRAHDLDLLLDDTQTVFADNLEPEVLHCAVEVKDVQADPQPSAEQSEPRQDTGKRGKCLRWNREGMICFFPCRENADEKEDGGS